MAGAGDGRARDRWRTSPDVDPIVVPIGGGGLIAGIARAPPDCRVVGVEPELSPRSTRGARGRASRCAIEPRSIADGLDAPFAGRARLARRAATRRRDVVLVTEDEIEDALRFLYDRAKLACEPAGAAATAALLAGKVAVEPGETVVAVVSGGNVAAETACCYPGSAMKADIHPEYVLATVHCSCGNDVPTRSTKPELHVEICSAVPPVLHGQAEARRHRRPGRALPAPAREGRRRPAPALARHHEHARSEGRPSSRA